jgi:hypothetical protein
METQIYPVSDATKERALIDKARYEEMYSKSISDNEAFWAEQAQRTGSRTARSTSATTVSIDISKTRLTTSR